MTQRTDSKDEFARPDPAALPLAWSNAKCRQLWHDDDGAVLAFSVVIWLALLVMAISVYAVGELIRQRIELQNAADAAAYSAAVTQADAMNRIAQTNRDMAWAYAQLVKMEMDYVTDKWLEFSIKRFDRDLKKVRDFNRRGTCNRGLPFYWCGRPIHRTVLLNGRHTVPTDYIKAQRAGAALSGRSWPALAARIIKHRTDIARMNRAQERAIRSLPSRLRDVAVNVLKANIQDSPNDRFSPAGSADIRYKLLPERGGTAPYFELEENEKRFLWCADKTPRDLGPGLRTDGRDGWFERKTAAGIKRGYARGMRSKLRAQWDWWSSRWFGWRRKCIPVGFIHGRTEVLGDDADIYDAICYNTAVTKPRRVKRSFFGKDGTIVVGVARRMNNPLAFLCPGRLRSSRSIFSLFSVDGGDRFLWAAAAARAGYRLPRSGKRGEYRTSYREVPAGDPDFWNLKTSDWDAVLLPLARAWARAENSRWLGGNSAARILSTLRHAAWKGLHGGAGGPLGPQRGPLGTTQAELAYERCGHLVLH